VAPRPRVSGRRATIPFVGREKVRGEPLALPPLTAMMTSLLAVVTNYRAQQGGNSLTVVDPGLPDRRAHR
jgi:hypothetical protein